MTYSGSKCGSKLYNFISTYFGSSTCLTWEWIACCSRNRDSNKMWRCSQRGTEWDRQAEAGFGSLLIGTLRFIWSGSQEVRGACWVSSGGSTQKSSGLNADSITRRNMRGGVYPKDLSWTSLRLPADPIFWAAGAFLSPYLSSSVKKTFLDGFWGQAWSSSLSPSEWWLGLISGLLGWRFYDMLPPKLQWWCCFWCDVLPLCSLLSSPGLLVTNGATALRHQVELASKWHELIMHPTPQSAC